MGGRAVVATTASGTSRPIAVLQYFGRFRERADNGPLRFPPGFQRRRSCLTQNGPVDFNLRTFKLLSLCEAPMW